MHAGRAIGGATCVGLVAAFLTGSIEPCPAQVKPGGGTTAGHCRPSVGNLGGGVADRPPRP